MSLLPVFATLFGPSLRGEEAQPLALFWEREMLSIRGPQLPGGVLQVWYLEAFCRSGSTRRDWKETVIPHRTRQIEASADHRLIRLRSELSDGVMVDHEIRAGHDEVDFRVVATNPGLMSSQAHWAQPCIRVDRFSGTNSEHGSEAYLPSCFIFAGDELTRLRVQPWAVEGRYTPGQVWCPEGVSRDDVNPRPLSTVVPSCGLIGCFSADGKQLVATAWEPYQELFQGVIVCLHSDFRIGGLAPRESKKIRGKIYLMAADVDALLARYRRDFPEHKPPMNAGHGGSRARKLIEFGWDEPDTAFLRKNQAVVEKTPFDGCVFHVTTRAAGKAQENFTWLCWGRRRFTEGELASAREDLSSISWMRFRHNFLRFNVTPGDLDWFDHHNSVLANARLAARLAREGHCQGILLDTEQYERGLFNFRKQRDAARKSWEDYAAQARRRGREVIAAFQDGYPDLTIFLTFGPSLLWRQSGAGTKPLADCDYGLLVPFLDGMIEGARGKTRIVDGYELSYGYRAPEQFATAYETISTKAAGLMSDQAAYGRVVSPGFGLWMDYDWRKRGWKPDALESNYFSPERFEAALRSALCWSDEYVWIYTETPRWWTSEGITKALPEAYVSAVGRARDGFCAK
jgi:hypothetical protein